MSENRETKGGRRVQKPEPSAPKRGGTKAPRPKRTGKALILHRVFIGVTIVAAIIVAAFLFINIFGQPPEVAVVERPKVTTTVDADGNEIETEVPGLSADRKKQFYTFLLIGRDTGGGGNTDTMMLVSYDVPNQAVNVMSLPRDTMVNIPYDIKRLNGVYNYAGGGDKGIDALDAEISQLVGFKPDFQVVVEWEAFGQLVEAIGGVDFDVPRRMFYNDLSQNFKIDLQAGMQHLDGDKAMQVIRWRHNSDDSGNILSTGYPDGDLGRVKTQQALMKEIIKKCLQPNVLIPKLGSYINIFEENVTTNLTASNLTYFVKSAVGGLNIDDVTFCTMPNTGKMVWSRSYHSMQSYVVPNADELVTLVNEKFNPYQDDLRKNELDIMYVNKDGTIGSTTGKVEDTKANSNVGQGSSSGKKEEAVSTPAPEPVDTETPTPTPTPNGGVVAPPGVESTPPQASTAPTATPAPSEPTPAPVESAAPAEPVPTPAPPADDEPILPPGA